jgi:chromosome segregation ATPase
MIRRRHRTREIPFSFDSFLDVVANVVGIIIRLILVVWVGARSYSSIQLLAKPKAKAVSAAEANLPADPLEAELARHRQELAAMQARLLEQLRQLDLTKEGGKKIEGQLKTLLVRRDEIDKQQTGLEHAKTTEARAVQYAALSLTELQQRHEKLLQEIRALEKLPPARKVLRYRTPVSQPVHT